MIRAQYRAQLRQAVAKLGFNVERIEAAKGRRVYKPLAGYSDAIYSRGRSENLIIDVELNIVRDNIGFGFGPEGWHPFVATLRGFIESSQQQYSGSILKAYYRRFRPTDLFEVFFDRTTVKPPCVMQSAEPLTSLHLPWELRPRTFNGANGLGQGYGWQLFGPISLTKGEMEYDRTVNTYLSIIENGFLWNRAPIKGTFLRIGDRYRFMINSGNHRAASLAARGDRTIPAAIDPRHLRVVDLADLHNWPAVASGLITSEFAQALFLRYFDGNGRSKACALGLV